MDTNWREAFPRGFAFSSMTILNADFPETKE